MIPETTSRSPMVFQKLSSICLSRREIPNVGKGRITSRSSSRVSLCVCRCMCLFYVVSLYPTFDLGLFSTVYLISLTRFISSHFSLLTSNLRTHTVHAHTTGGALPHLIWESLKMSLWSSGKARRRKERLRSLVKPTASLSLSTEGLDLLACITDL